MRKIAVLVALLEVYALALVFLALPGGVRTDEAKYLLNIPYPHPPLIRSVIAWGSFLPLHDLLVRAVFASLIVQSAWIVWDFGRVLTRPRRITLVMSWLFSSAIILQGGMVMLAPITALFGLMFLSLSLSPQPVSRKAVPFVAILWLIGLLSAYQVLLYLPLAWSAIRRAKVSFPQTAVYILLPVLVLGVYSLANPLALASMTIVSSVAPSAVAARLSQAGMVWLLALSGIGSVVGVAGIVMGRRKGLLLTLLLVVAYIMLSPQDYYAVLLTPVLLGGLFLLFCRRRVEPALFLPLSLVLSLFLVASYLPPLQPSPARGTLNAVEKEFRFGTLVLIDGPFGHDWQYWSTLPVRRFTQDLRSDVEQQALAIVCTKQSCEEDIDLDTWMRLPGAPAEVWVRK